jgi:hypothetical protein
MDDQSSRFLDAFNGIEKHLRKVVKAEKHLTFGELVEKASRVSRPVARYVERLRTGAGILTVWMEGRDLG